LLCHKRVVAHGVRGKVKAASSAMSHRCIIRRGFGQVTLAKVLGFGWLAGLFVQGFRASSSSFRKGSGLVREVRSSRVQVAKAFLCVVRWSKSAQSHRSRRWLVVRL